MLAARRRLGTCRSFTRLPADDAPTGAGEVRPLFPPGAQNSSRETPPKPLSPRATIPKPVAKRLSGSPSDPGSGDLRNRWVEGELSGFGPNTKAARFTHLLRREITVGLPAGKGYGNLGTGKD